MSKPHLHKVIGIDLGTTYSAVAAYNPTTMSTETLINTADVNAPSAGTTTASVISLDPLTRKAVVGDWAKKNGAADPLNTIIEIKREMGEMFSAKTLAKFVGERMNHPEFREGNQRNKLVEGEPVRAHFSTDWLLPQELSAFILMRMKQIAEQEIGEEIRDAVITVPAYFTERQRAATREAALLAGLYPRQILPEPTAAAIAYGLEKFEMEKKRYLVYDLGGGTFDVSIIEVEGQTVQVISTSGDRRLGGGDFDDAIAAWATDQLTRQFGFDLNRLISERAMRFRAEIKLKSEQAKIILSNAQETNISFPELMADLHLQTPPILRLTRDKFEELIGEYLRRSLSYVDEAIKSAEVNRSVKRDDISAIILVGGSSKIPRVKLLLLEYFQKGDDFIRVDADPDQIVARGAATEAFRYQPSPPPFDARRPMDNAGLMNTEAAAMSNVFHITEHTLSVGVQKGLVARIIAQGTNLPTEETKDHFSNVGPTDKIDVHVFQGESQFQAECTQIGTVPITGLEPLPADKHRFAVTFKLDMSGLLTATVRQVSTGQLWSASLQHKAGVGGLDAIATLRNKLLGIFSGTVSNTAPPMSPPVHPSAQSAPWGHPSSAQMPTPPVAMPPPSYGTPLPNTQPPWVTSPSFAPPVAVFSPLPPAAPQSAVPSTPAAATPQPTPSPAVGGQTLVNGIALVSATAELGRDEAQLVRRSHKLLLRNPDSKLVRACNEYVSAWNNGVKGDDLSDLLADLRDAFTYVQQQTP